MTSKARFFHRSRLWGLVSGLALLVVQFFIPALMGTAHAAPTCTTNGNQVTCTFSYTGAPETWTVPANVTQVTAEVSGAQGGDILAANGFLREGGGRGGKATATLAVQPGATYQINVGGRGELRNFVAGGGGAGGFNGGASASAGFDSTGGGGGSDIRTGSFSLAERAIVAGGGGGIGGSCGSVFGGDGGGGGGVSGAAGFPSFAGAAEAVGGGGTQTDGGSGGAYLNSVPASELAQAGSFGFGGTGARLSSTVGGGGGGGYYGGGGGGISPGCPAAGGGGGGSGYGPTGVIFASGVRAGDGLVILTYTPDTTAPVILSTIDGVSGSNGWYVSPVTVNFTCTDEADGSGLATDTVAGATLTNDGAGQSITSTGECTDNAGNSATPATVGGINIDQSAPVFGTCPVAGPFALNSGVKSVGPITANADISGLNAGASTLTGSVDTSSSGTKNVTFSATDNAGNTATQQCSYLVNSAPALAVAADGAACLSDSSAKGVIKLVLGDADGGPSPLTLSLVSNSNTALVPNNNVVLGGSGANRTLTVTAAAKKSGTALLTLRVSDGLNSTDLLVNVVVGTDKNETLNGTGGTDLIFGLLGANTINGLGSNDLLCGGNGVDTINGGDGDDTLGGNRGNDVLNGEGGNDRLTGGQGADRFSGGPGSDSATDFTPSQGDTNDGTTELVTVLAAGEEEPAITNQIFLPTVQN